MKRRDMPWQPISPARKRKLKKLGHALRWDAERETWLRERPGQTYRLIVNGIDRGEITDLRVDYRRHNQTKLGHLREVVAAAVRRQRSITITLSCRR